MRTRRPSGPDSPADAASAAPAGKAGARTKTALLPPKRRPLPSSDEATDAGDVDADEQTSKEQTEAAVSEGTASDGALRLLVDDYPLAPGQMVKADFLGDLRVQVTMAADEELGPAGLSAIGCPYIEEYFQRYAGRSAAEGEAFLRRFVPELAHVRSARDSIPLVLERVRAGIRAWRTSGKAPADVIAAEGGGGGAADASSATVASTIASFGPGAPLDGGVASRMADAFEQTLPDVTLHTGPEAAQATAAADARAMTVGTHVAFAPGAYDPGSPEGEALLAHELAHTVQQDGAGAAEANESLAEERHADEEDADRAAGGVLARMWGGIKRGASALMGRTRTAVRSGFRLQRCKGGTTPNYSWKSHRQGPHEQRKIGSVEVRQIAVMPSIPAPVFEMRTLTVGKTVAELPSSDEALAVAKTLEKRAVVIAGEGMFFVYELERDGGFLRQALAPVTIDLGDRNLRIDETVVAVVTSNGAVFRPGLHGAVADNREQANAYGNPFAPYIAVNEHKGGLSKLEEDELLAVFQAAMRDNALAILGESQRQASVKAKQFDGGSGAVSATEHETIETTARAALDVQTRIETINTQMGKLLQARLNLRKDADFVPDIPESEALAAQLKLLQAERRRIDATYPMIGRYRDSLELQTFLGDTKEERVARLAGDARGVLSNITETRDNVLAGAINLWLVPGVVESTIAGLGLGQDSQQRKWVLDKAAAQAKADAVSTIALAAFSIGLGLAAAFTTGGASLALTVGAMGLGVYDALEATDDYYVKKAGTDTDIDKIAGASLLPDEMRAQWGWLVVAWVGVGLDLADTVKAARFVHGLQALSKAPNSSVDDLAVAMADGDVALLGRLRKAAGDLKIEDVITQQNVDDVSRRVGAHVTITNEPGGSVRVRYALDEPDVTRVTGVEVGRTAKIGDILAHAETVRLLDRRTTVVRRLQDLWARLRTFGKSGKVGKSGAMASPFPAGSAAFESWLELQKLDDLLAIRRAQLDEALRAGSDAGETQSLIRRDIEFLNADLERHRAVVDNVSDMRGGRGFVAMEDDTKQALANGKKLPDVDKPADEVTEADLIGSDFYFARGDDGEWTPTLKADRTAASASAGVLASPTALTALRTSMKARIGAHADVLMHPALVALSKLGDTTLSQLKTAAAADLERLAAMLMADPPLAQRLAGKRNVLGSLMNTNSNEPIDLDRALFMQRVGDVKADGKPDRLWKAITSANLTGEQLDSLTYGDLAELGKADAALARARDAREPERMKESLGHFDKMTGADAGARAELRSALSHVHGISDVPFMLDPGAALRARFPDLPKAAMDDLVARHPDALRALEDASEDDVRRVIQALGGAGNPKDVEDILRSYMYKAQKKARKSKEALEAPTDVGDRIEESLSNLGEARKRGYPFGFKDRPSYEKFVSALDQEIKKRGIAGKAQVQGSAMHSKTPGDIDVEILVEDSEFNRLANSFRASVRKGSKDAIDLEAGIAKRKIPSYHFFPHARPSVADAVTGFTAANDGKSLSVQATLVVEGSDFDLGPFL